MRSASTGLRAASRRRLSPEQLPASTSQGGFTLLETLTAMTILAIAITGLFQAHANATRSTGTADDYATARLLAESLLAEAVAGWPSASRSGREGRFVWEVGIAPAKASWAEIKSKENWHLYRLQASVLWEGGRRVDLETVKLARPNAPPR
jgi:prepilin-type N-terminal cleavage/methylation domain-containing protein